MVKWLFSPGVALLPFVDERRLRAALEEVYPDLTPEESKSHSAHLINVESVQHKLHFCIKVDFFFHLESFSYRRHKLLIYLL